MLFVLIIIFVFLFDHVIVFHILCFSILIFYVMFILILIFIALFGVILGILLFFNLFFICWILHLIIILFFMCPIIFSLFRNFHGEGLPILFFILVIILFNLSIIWGFCCLCSIFILFASIKLSRISSNLKVLIFVF